MADPGDGDRDPVALQEVVAWTPTSILDRGAVVAHRAVVRGFRWLIIGTAVLLLALITSVTALSVVTEPFVFSLVILSVVPAFGLAAFIWMADVGAEEPLSLLTATLLLGMLFAAFAGVVNTVGIALWQLLPVATLVLFYYVVVGPVEEGVKLLAVRLHAFRHRRFDAVIDGAVYGAVAGLGFATIENALYITAAIDAVGQPETVVAVGEQTAVRALAGPGHVIYSAIAGYYLGLAKFNPGFAGALVVKGLAIAAVLHATYNVLVQTVPDMLAALAGTGVIVGLLVFIVVYDGLAAYYLYRKLSRYRTAYRASRGGRPGGPSPELVEFDGR